MKQGRLSLWWGVFVGILVTFVVGVEVLHRTSSSSGAVYQCRILIDKDFAADEVYQEERVKPECISLYERTSYGELPKKQMNHMKIFNAYSADCDCAGEYVKSAILVEDATVEKILAIIKLLRGAKVSFVIPHYADDLPKIANAIISNGYEFFIQLPTQSSIPLGKQDTVSPFLANDSANDTIDKLNYLIASAKYAIGVANTSPSLITKSKRDMSIIINELSQRGMAFLNIREEDDTLKEIADSIKFTSLEADLLESNSLRARSAVLVHESQIPNFLKMIPAGVKLVPMSFGVKNASA